jgi:hypothetical protein
MSKLCAWTTVPALAVLAGGCTADLAPIPGSPTGFEYAYAAPDCAPWDGYAVSIVLRGAPLASTDTIIEAGAEPQLRVSLYPRGAAGLVPATYRWPEQPEAAAAARCENGSCEPIPSGRLEVRSIAPDSTLSGQLELRLQNGNTIHGGFRADWRSRRFFCR